MPELPEVEAMRRTIESSALHQTISEIDVRDKRVLEVTPQKLWGNVTGHRFEAVERHGKYIFAQLDNDKFVVFHFGMTGDIAALDDASDAPEHSRIVFHFEDETHLAFDNQRLFGEVSIVDDKESFIQAHDLGPDVLELDYDTFKDCLSDKRGMIKTALMDQSVFAGIGNEYSDEILFQVGLHPETQLKQLGEDHLQDIFEQMQSVMKTAIKARNNGQDLPDSFLMEHRDDGASCPNCSGKVHKISISGRNGYYCPDCQEKID